MLLEYHSRVRDLEFYGGNPSSQVAAQVIHILDARDFRWTQRLDFAIFSCGFLACAG